MRKAFDMVSEPGAISAGRTPDGLRSIFSSAAVQVVGEAAVFTEGDERETEGIVSLGHLPLFPQG